MANKLLEVKVAVPKKSGLRFPVSFTSRGENEGEGRFRPENSVTLISRKREKRQSGKTTGYFLKIFPVEGKTSGERGEKGLRIIAVQQVGNARETVLDTKEFTFGFGVEETARPVK